MEIIKYPDARLKEKCEKVSVPLSKEDSDLINEMYAWLKEHSEEAVGLSACQVGVLKRMCVIKHKMPMGNTVNYKLVNPVIIKHSSKVEYLPEGCLSIDEEHNEPVKRYTTVAVAAFDCIQNRNIVIEATGYLARILQHEIDHLDGILYTDRLEEQGEK